MILKAKYYDYPAKFYQAITKIFLTVNQKYSSDLKNLLTRKFIPVMYKLSSNRQYYQLNHTYKETYYRSHRLYKPEFCR